VLFLGILTAMVVACLGEWGRRIRNEAGTAVEANGSSQTASMSPKLFVQHCVIFSSEIALLYNPLSFSKHLEGFPPGSRGLATRKLVRAVNHEFEQTND
jgi:hypothetical protein